MAAHTLVAIHDPRRTLAPEVAGARVAAALGADGSVRRAGPLTLGWTGDEVVHARTLGVVDGDLAIPAGLTSSWPAALTRLHGLRGAFALIVWDEDARRGLVARDHLGARPLFYAASGSALYVASEIAPLIAALPQRPAPDLDEVARRLAGRRGELGATLYAGVRELPPAHALLLDEHGWRAERYWRPQPHPGLAGADRATAAAALREGIRRAVRRHAPAAPASAGVLVSGGLDSSAVLACVAADARAAGGPPPLALTGVPDRPELEESGFVEALSTHLSTDVERVPVRAGPIVPMAVAHLERWSVPLEHPGGAFFMPVQEAAAARGAAVVLDGEGGDELFGCEPLLIADRLLAGDVRGAVRLTRALPGMIRLDARSLRVVLRNWIVPGVLSPTALARLRRLRAGRRAPPPAWLGPAARRAIDEPEHQPWRPQRGPRWRAHRAWLLTDAQAALGAHDHLRRVAALAGVRDAHPFLDVDLIELVLGLPPHLAFDSRLDRALLRGAMRGLLPERVRLREDKVFFDPLLLASLTGPDRRAVARTLTGASLELGGLVDAAELRTLWTDGPGAHPGGPRAWSADIWRAFALETWLRQEVGRE
jgi:asparagine synthase (glutamine-hydrolysing)